MGNTNSHVNERRKSTSGDTSRPPSTAHHQPSERVRHSSGGFCRDSTPTTYDNRGAIGPVDITKPGKTPTKLLSTTGSALSRTVRGFRPRSGTGDNTSSGPRARANTVSSGQRPRPRRYATVDVPDPKSSGNGGSSDSNDRERKDSGPNAAEFMQTCSIADAQKKLPTIFKFNAPVGSKDVFVAGTFNNWQKLKMCPSAKDFIAIVDLNEGEHEYKFMVDGEWQNNPSEPTTNASEGSNGIKNNIIHVQKEDFDAYHALDMDSKAVAAAQQNHKKRMFNDTFSQEIPPYVTQSEYRSGPPILPPHLNQVILNKDTPLSCEPTLLPEPKHVMLNHLYALSIKDGVMVLSSSQRFKHKYVTTLLYKPMGVRKTP